MGYHERVINNSQIMVTQDLLDYISAQTKTGFSKDEIRQSLINNGWDGADVDTALNGMTPTPQNTVPPAPAGISREEAAVAVKKMGKFKGSWALFTQSLRLLKQDKEVVLFPILSAVILMIVSTIVVVSVWLSGLVDSSGEEAVITNMPVFYGVVFIYYVISYFILTYFRVGLTAVVYERINGGDIGFKEGMARATNIGGKIFVWSVLAATVGLVLKIISDRSKLLGKLAASLLGAAWAIVTMFIAPTLLLDNVSVWQSVKNSGAVFKKTWGETLILNISLSIVSRILVFGTIILFGILAITSVSLGFGVISLLVLGILYVFTVIITSIIFTSLSEIFKVALYSYARFGVIAEGFSPEFIVGAVKEPKQK